MAEKIFIPVYVPRGVRRSLQMIKRRFSGPDSTTVRIDIGGERNIEWSFLSGEMGEGPGEALDFGCEQGYLSLAAAQRGYQVIANDLEPQAFCWVHPNVKFVQGDFLKLELPKNHFDLVIDCSSVEHVGVAGRYGISVNEEDRDIAVMRRFEEILKPCGKVLMTVPCGQDTVMAPWCRVYGAERLPRLFGSLRCTKEVFWHKNRFNQWTQCDRQTALSFTPRNDKTNPHGCAYNLGCFVLQKAVLPGS